MHSHDHDLIAALAEGILAEELASAAEAEIAACLDCAADLAAQQAALEATGALPPAALTPSESAHLRDAVAGALGVAGTAAPRAAKRSRRSPWPAIAIAAGLAGIITIVPVMGLITGGSDAGDSARTMPAAFEEFDEGSGERDTVAEAPTEDAEFLATPPAPSTVETTAAPAPETAAAATTTTAALNVGEGQAGVDLAADGQAAILELFEAGPTEGYVAATQQTERSSLSCNAEAEQHFGNAFLYVDQTASLDDGRPVILYAAADWSVLVAFDLADCTAVLTLP